MALADDPSGERPRMFALADNGGAVDDDVGNAFGILMGIRPGGFVDNAVGIENHQIGKVTLFDLPPSVETEFPRRH